MQRLGLSGAGGLVTQPVHSPCDSGAAQRGQGTSVRVKRATQAAQSGAEGQRPQTWQ
jgi:hypothetical protein